LHLFQKGLSSGWRARSLLTTIGGVAGDSSKDPSRPRVVPAYSPYA